jgi:hypothetical protein
MSTPLSLVDRHSPPACLHQNRYTQITKSTTTWTCIINGTTWLVNNELNCFRNDPRLLFYAPWSCRFSYECTLRWCERWMQHCNYANFLNRNTAKSFITVKHFCHYQDVRTFFLDKRLNKVTNCVLFVFFEVYTRETLTWATTTHPITHIHSHHILTKVS